MKYINILQTTEENTLIDLVTFHKKHKHEAFLYHCESLSACGYTGQAVLNEYHYFNEVIFIDDINRVSEVSRYYQTGFIGTPVTNYQKDQMIETGVKHIIESVANITKNLLIHIDEELLSDRHWS